MSSFIALSSRWTLCIILKLSRCTRELPWAFPNKLHDFDIRWPMVSDRIYDGYINVKRYLIWSDQDSIVEIKDISSSFIRLYNCCGIPNGSPQQGLGKCPRMPSFFSVSEARLLHLWLWTWTNQKREICSLTTEKHLVHDKNLSEIMPNEFEIIHLWWIYTGLTYN